MAAGTAAPADSGLLSMIQEIEAATTMGELVAAGHRLREVLNKASSAVYGASDAVYVKVKKSGRWPGGIDKMFEASRERKLYDEAGAALKDAAIAVRAVVTRQEEILSASKAKAQGFDATR